MDALPKKTLRSLSLELRHTLEGSYSDNGTWNAGDLERRLNQIGVWRDRSGKPIGEMPNLSPVDRKARELIDAYLSLRSDAGVSQSDAVAEFVRESAYSWANRLFALRCMEARGIIDPVVLQEETYGGRSMVHNRFAQRNPNLCLGEDDGLFAVMLEEFRERSRELPDLFAPDSPAVALRPSVAALKRCIGLLSGTVPVNGGPATDDVFTAPDAFGWAYQYWNAEEKDRVFEMVRTKKGAKIEGADIIPATQLYTEPYMVKFLVQNSLGATWMMIHPESKLCAAWEYYVKDADRAPADTKSVAEITFLDPACGSGHFLIEAFDLFYAMYEEEGELKQPIAICQSILNNNLFGIDIDERAVQITKAVLWMKAADTIFAKTNLLLAGDGLADFHDHIIATNIRLPKGRDHLDAFLKKHPEDAPLRPALLTVFEGLQNVHELGSLVQIEEPVDKELKFLQGQAKQLRFDPESGEIVEKVNFPRWKQQVMKRLKAHFQDEAQKALPTESFFSQSAVMGLALFDLLSRRYDVVAANPPYMGSKNMGGSLKKYVEVHYPEGRKDLYASFIIRDIQLANRNGYVSMVTQEGWIFLQSFSQLRYNKNASSGLLYKDRVNALIHLGSNAFEEISGEVVRVVLCIIQKTPTERTQKIWVNRLIDYNRPELKAEYLRRAAIGVDSKNIFSPNAFDLCLIPSAPIAYWLPKNAIQIINSSVTLGNENNVSRGVDTCNNDRFVRFFWEIANHRSEWLQFLKGGGYGKWAGQNYWLLDYRDDGTRVKSFVTERYPYLKGNSEWLIKTNTFGQAGWAYSLMAQGSLGVRFIERNQITSNSTRGIFTKTQKLGLGPYLNSRFCSFILRTLSNDIKFSEGYIASLPLLALDDISDFHVTNCIQLKKYILSFGLDETYYRNYQKSNTLRKTERLNSELLLSSISVILTIEGIFERFILKKSIIDESFMNTIIQQTGVPSGWFPVISGYDNLPILSEEFSGGVDLKNTERIYPSIDALKDIKNRIRSIYEAGPGTINEVGEEESSNTEDGDDSLSIGIRIRIPPETFLEELSQKIEIHPVSIYWLLKEGIEKEGWRCIPEEKRYTEDLFTEMVLRLLGHRWPQQIEAGESVPEWADTDGIIPITSGLTHPTLLQQIQDRIAAEFPGGRVHEIEKEFEEVVGMSLERWLAGEFFKHHISQFKKRPIAWQLSSSPSGAVSGKGKSRGSRRDPVFSCLIYYHKTDADILHKIRTQYVGDLSNRYGTELRSLESRERLTTDQATRKVQLDNWITELNDFAKALQDVADAGFESSVLKEIVKIEPLDEWTSHDGKAPHSISIEEFYAQEKRYDPDINDGVRVNIIPLQKAGLLAADVIAKKDVEKAIADRAYWRADERRWCREGKLPKCGWWGKK